MNNDISFNKRSAKATDDDKYVISILIAIIRNAVRSSESCIENILSVKESMETIIASLQYLSDDDRKKTLDILSVCLFINRKFHFADVAIQTINTLFFNVTILDEFLSELRDGLDIDFKVSNNYIIIH